MKQFVSPLGIFSLSRNPLPDLRDRQAWDAADEYLLDHVRENLVPDWPILICNDALGGLSIPLADRDVTTVVDSVLSEAAIRGNLKRNSMEEDRVRIMSPLNLPDSGEYSIILRPPKHRRLLEMYLTRLRPLIREGGCVIAADMTRHVHAETLNTFERIIGPTVTSLARKKARLIISELDPDMETIQEDFISEYAYPEADLVLCQYPGVFSADRLDPGTRLLLENSPALDEKSKILDLGCGNGILGFTLLRANPTAELTLAEQSRLALASARVTFQKNFPDSEANVRFHLGNGLDDITSNSLDVIVCNPPFHLGHSREASTARKLFRDAARTLRHDGRIRVVGNRSLGYHSLLETLFGTVKLVAENKKFVIWEARYPRARPLRPPNRPRTGRSKQKSRY